MKIDFALRTLFVADLWLAMSIITSIILEMTIVQYYNGLISVCIFLGGILLNLIACLAMINVKNNILKK